MSPRSGDSAWTRDVVPDQPPPNGATTDPLCSLNGRGWQSALRIAEISETS
jgi:hypothetical protein